MEILGGFAASGDPVDARVIRVAFQDCDFLFQDEFHPTVYFGCCFERCRFSASREEVLSSWRFPGGYFEDCVFGVDPKEIASKRSNPEFPGCYPRYGESWANASRDGEAG